MEPQDLYLCKNKKIINWRNINLDKENIAVIDIGSGSIKMSIYEIKKNGFDILEELRQPIRLGKDTFEKGSINRNTIDECVHILKKFKKLCKEYKVNKISAVATTAVREAINIDIFLDNIWTNTNIEIEILPPSKEMEYTYSALIDYIDLNDFKDQYWCILKIGTGNVELTVIEGDCIIFTRSLPLGILKLKELFLKEFSSEDYFNNFLKVMIKHELQNLKLEVSRFKVSKIFGVGFNINVLSEVLGQKDKNEILKINRQSLRELCDRIEKYTEEEIVHKLNIPFSAEETFYASSYIFLKVIDFFNCNDVYATKVSLRDGVVKHLYFDYDRDNYFIKLEKQLKINALNIGKSLNFDEKHGLKVMELSLKIFDETADIHRLGQIERCYLLISAILHDIGLTISYRSHHKHSHYIIKAQEFFSLKENQVNIIANIARYHRRSEPKKSHIEYMSFSHNDRMIITKLASILRIADGFDNSHLQLIDDIKIERVEEGIIINAYVDKQLYSEVYSFNYKKKMFENFFGIKLKLRIINKNER
jgi:exopolyphosphatase/guanosine-5'-triphosphate,3'-diphosphate pyrophosphatase